MTQAGQAKEFHITLWLSTGRTRERALFCRLIVVALEALAR